MQEVTTDVAVEGKTISDSIDAETGLAGIIGMAGGFVQNVIPRQLLITASNGEELFVATGKEALEFGGQQFAEITDRMLFAKQLEAVIAPRFSLGALVGNVPLPQNEEKECTWTCPIESFQRLWQADDEAD